MRKGSICRGVMRKIAGNDGISILYALMLMLVAVVVSAVTLGAAVTAARRVDADSKWKQERLTLDSAGTVMRGMLQETHFTIKTVTDDATGQATTEVISSEGPLSEILEDTLVAVAQHESGGMGNPSPLSIEVIGYPDVTMTYAMSSEEPDLITGETNPQDRYRITATLRMDGGRQSLLLDAYQSNASSIEVEDGEGTVTVTEEVSWSDITVGTYAGDGKGQT